MFEKIKELKDECPICEKRRHLVYGKRTEAVSVHGEEIPVKVNVYHCIDGDHYFYDLKDEENKYQTVYREYRRRKGLLQPEEIRLLREKYGLSQRAFAKFLGWGAITIQRYETGALQDNGHNSLLNFLKVPDNFERYYDSRKSLLPERITRTIEKSLREIDEKETQLELDFFFRHIRPEAAEVIMGKSANREPRKSLIEIFARLETARQFQTSVDIVKISHSPCWKPGRKMSDRNGNFSADAKGELALAA